MSADLSKLFNRWKSTTVLVIGDLILDSYLEGYSERLAQEAPVPVVAVQGQRDFAGGAANVAANIVSLGGRVSLLSVMGQDAAGDRLQHTLNHYRVATGQLITASQRTTLTKRRILANGHLLARLDSGSTEAIPAELEDQLIERLIDLFPRYSAVLISDYGYGILTPRAIEVLRMLQQRYPQPLVVDSKSLTAFRQLRPTAVKPNYKQAIALLGLTAQPQNRALQIIEQGDRLLDLTGAKIVAATLDQEGAIILEQGHSPFFTRCQPVPVGQTSGAGDTYISALTLALAAGAETGLAASVATAAAAAAVSQTGTATCTIEQLRQQFIDYRQWGQPVAVGDSISGHAICSQECRTCDRHDEPDATLLQ